jgi:hypothetical protein
MRFSDIKLVESKVLYEAANAGLETQHTLHDLDAISSSVASIPTDKVDAKMSLVSKLEKMAASVTALVSKLTPKQPAKTEPVALNKQPQATDPNATVEAKANPEVQKKLYSIKDYEAADARAAKAIQEIKDAINNVMAMPIDDAQKDSIVKQINTPLDKLVKEFDVVRAQRDSAAAERDKAINFVKEVTGTLVTLGNKVQGFQDLDTVSMASKDRASYKKMAVNAEKFTKTLKQALFGKILDMQEGSDVTQEEIKTFLEACVAGDVINMLGVIGTDRGNISQHVNPKYQKVFDVFVKENIFSYSPGTTSGAIGPGEMALSMMGNPAEKGKKGDLKIGDQEVEIKASAQTGGRLNSKSIAKATTGWTVWKEGIAAITAGAPKDATIKVTGKKGERTDMPISKFDGDQFNMTKDKAKLGNKYNWNQKGFQALNEEILQPYSNFDKTFALFHNTIKALVQNFDQLEKKLGFKPDALIANSVEQDGTVDWLKMNKAYAKIAYSSYHLADGITTIMFLRTDTLDYTIIKDGNDFVSKLGTEVVMGGGFNWNDDQQTPTPGYNAAPR